MKGKLLRGYSQDLQRTIVAGAELEILESWCGVGGFFYRCQLSDGSQVVLSDKDIAELAKMIYEEIKSKEQ